MNMRNERTLLGRRLREMREYGGYSQDEVGEYLKLSRSAISLIEAGSRKTDALELRKLAKLYQCTTDELTGSDLEDTESQSVRLLARTAADLSPQDRSEVLRFARFLKSRPKDTENE